MGWRERYGAERTVEVLPDEGEELMHADAASAVNVTSGEGYPGA
jgi:NADH-quinone oxidoreductase subunit B